MAGLKLTNRRLPLASAMALDASEKAQVSHVLKSEDAGSIASARKDEEWSSLELVDVMRGGALAYRFVLYPFGSGTLFEGTSTKVLFDVVQHGIELHAGTPGALVAELGEAFARDAKGLGVRETVDFDAPEKKPDALTSEEALAAAEPKIAAGKPLTDGEVTAVSVALKRELGKSDGPRRAEDLSPIARRLATVMAKGGRFLTKSLDGIGLPNEGRALEVWLGLRSAAGLQRAIMVGGREASVLEHARAVVKGKQDGAPVIDAISVLGERDAVEILDRLLRFDPDERITSFPWEVSEGVAARWLVQLTQGIGPAAVAKVGELVLAKLVTGNLARIYVWSQVTPKITATPAAFAKRIRELHAQGDWQGFLPSLLAKLPDADEVLPGYVPPAPAPGKSAPSKKKAPAQKAAPTKKAPAKKAPTKKPARNGR